MKRALIMLSLVLAAVLGSSPREYAQDFPQPMATTLQNAAVANGNGNAMTVTGMSSAILTVNCATCSGGTTVNFEGSEDGTNFTAVAAVQVGTTTIATTTATAGVTVWELPVAGFQQLRARVSGYSAGTVTVTVHAVPVSYDPKVVNANIVSNTATNQSVNLAQVAGATTATGNGTAAGSVRVSVASDSSGNIASIGTSVTPGTAAANLGKAEDAAGGDGDTGVAVWGRRNEAGTAYTSADGDYGALLNDAYGALLVRQDHPKRFHCVVAVSTATTIQAVGGSCAAPGAGLSLYITDVMFSTSASGIAADAFPTLKSGTQTTNPCDTGTAVIWQALTASAGVFVDNRSIPIKVTANNAVCWITSTAGSKALQISGFIAQ